MFSTHDRDIPNATLYQAEPRPENLSLQKLRFQLRYLVPHNIPHNVPVHAKVMMDHPVTESCDALPVKVLTVLLEVW